MKLRIYKKFFQELIKYISDGIHVIDNFGNTIYYNKRMEEIEQLTGQEVISKPFSDLISNVDDSTMIRSMKSKEVIFEELQNYVNHQGKQVVTVNTTIPIIEDDNVIAVMEVARNITQIQEMSDKIIELRNEKTDKDLNFDKKLHYTFDSIVGESKSILKSISMAKNASMNDASVFIFGETGTGKELFAQSIHYDGKRKNKPFIAQNCAAIPEALLEGLLFGTAKGGFTGAVDREGLFEQANGGTLLLDEINSMPYDTQSKLLRVLQERYVRRVGGTKDIPIDVRIIAISNESSEDLLKNKNFRKDLFYRLNVISINVPPLRERKEDIIPIAKKIIKKYNQIMNKDVLMISLEAEKLLKKHDYPGNVRELENIIARGISSIDYEEKVLEDYSIQINSLEDNKQGINISDNILELGLDNYIENLERQIIEKKLIEFDNNITKAANSLKIKRQTLQHKLKKYNIAH